MTQHRPERRARTVAMVGLIFSILVSVFFLLLTSWSDSEALRALTRFTAVGNLIWFFLVLIYHQRVLVQDEAFESEQIRRERAAGVIGEAIFDVDDEELLLARRRLRWMYRWVLPAFTILIIGSLVAVGLAAWEWELNASVWRRDWPGVKHSGLLAWFVGGASFLSFLLSRYAVGMARHAEWRMLRAGASWLMGVTLAGLTLVVTLGILHFSPTSPVSERILAYVLRILLLVLAGEILLNFVLDFYRPRGVDDEPRPAFDSRLLGLFSEPGGIARSIAEAINYQFGFEVSSTWFYKLLQRSVVPLLGFGVAAMLAASCLVFVENNEEAVVERFGSRLPRVLGPGVHAKLPWPVDIAYKVASSKVHELKIGIEPPKDPNRPPRDDDSLILWTNQHSQEPHLEVLVATPRLESYVARAVLASQPAAGAPTTQPGEADAPIQAGEAVAVSMMRVAVSLQYQIRDAADWLTTYDKPEEMLKAIANREIIRYCASVDVNGLIGGQRSQIEKALWETIQKRTDEAKLGVEIVFLGRAEGGGLDP
jgi:membrane protease subunit HflK